MPIVSDTRPSCLEGKTSLFGSQQNSMEGTALAYVQTFLHTSRTTPFHMMTGAAIFSTPGKGGRGGGVVVEGGRVWGLKRLVGSNRAGLHML